MIGIGQRSARLLDESENGTGPNAYDLRAHVIVRLGMFRLKHFQVEDAVSRR
jgi:hypothetical protein